jgi:hypothetical protein
MSLKNVLIVNIAENVSAARIVESVNFVEAFQLTNPESQL